MKIAIAQKVEKLSSNNIIAILFIFFSFFPYLKIIETGSDLQPLSFLVGIIFIFTKLNRIRFHRHLHLILFTILFALFFFFVSSIKQFDIALLRGLYSYISIFVHFFVAYDIIKSKPFFLSLTVELATYCWFIVGFVQNYFNSDFLTFLLSRGSGFDGKLSGRGVLSLAVEPTYYGIHCFFLLLFVLLIINATKLYSKNKGYLLLILCLIQIIVLARSSMVILFLLIIIGNIIFRYFFKKPIYAFFAIFTVFMLIDISISLVNTNSRMFIIASTLLESPKEILALDRSINERVSDIYYSIKGFLSYPLGHGLNGWQSYLTSESSSQIFVKTEQTRIMSFLGSFLFELGIFSIFLFYFIFRNVGIFLNGIKMESYTWYLVALLILFTSIQQSYPPLWLLFSSAIVLTNENKAIQSNLTIVEN